jgi:hypothetical protein
MLRRLLLIPGLLAAFAVGGVALAAAGAATPACAGSDRHALVSARPGATHELVPPGAVTVLLCRYSGFWNGSGPRRPPFRLLVRVLVTDAARVARFERELNSLPRLRAPIACPAGFGANLIARFRYASGPEDPVTIALDGCIGAANGHIGRSAIGLRGTAVVADLARAAGFALRG